MKILFIGDVTGAVGRDMLARGLEDLQYTHKIDFTIVNAENAAHGRGMSYSSCEELMDMHIDVITMGNHVWDNTEIFKVFDCCDSVIRPANLQPSVPGKGSVLVEKNGVKVGVINLLGQINCLPCDNPFAAADREIEALKAKGAQIIFVDFHAEATSEKVAMGHYLDGRASAVIGTHTHIQTADEKILPRGCAYLTDAGMTGPYHSILGVKVEIITKRFVTGLPQRFEVAEGKGQINGVVVEIDESTGKAQGIERISFVEK